MKRIEQLEQTARGLEPGPAQRSELSAKAVAYVDQFVTSLPHLPGFTTGSIDKLKALEIGEAKPLDQLLNILHEEVDAVGINSASGKHMGYIPGGGLWTSAIADMLAAGANRYAGIAYSSPGAVEIENQLIRWLTALVGYPATAHGNLTAGGSTANMIAIKAARDFHQVNADNVKTAVIYFTGHTHHCIYKALHITGLHEAVLRPVALNAHFQMDHLDLQRQIESDIAEGLRPFLVVATAGTTNTGAIDPLHEIAALSKRHNIWFHVDAAYGGFFILVDEIRERFKGIEQADSLVMDPHKTLFIPYGSGVVLVKNKQALLASFSHTATYMKDALGVDEIDPSDTGPELSRHFRGMRMWLPLHLHGLAPFKANLEEKLLLCRYFYEQIGQMGFETGPAPDLSVAIFRYTDDDDNHKSEQLINALHQDGRVFFSSTTINGKLWIRCAVVSFRTHLDIIHLALTMIKENVDLLLRSKQLAN
jgi:glutamate/tyrosine decarboxylase-like PLP-dependent enzyme